MKTHVALDTETFLIQPGLLAPPLVCVSTAWRESEEEIDSTLLDKKTGTQVLGGMLRDTVVLIGANVSYDLAVLCAHDESLIPLVFQAYEDGRIRDVQIRQQLIDIRNGCLNLPRPDGTKGVSLGTLAQHYLGKDRSAEKNNPDAWRLRYAELVDVPLEKWPKEAVDYAKEDASDTLEIWELQTKKYGELLPTEILQTQAAFALHLMSAWGIRTNGERVAVLKKHLEEEKAKTFEDLKAAGLYKLGGTKKAPKWTKDTKVIKERVKAAFEKAGKEPPLTPAGEREATNWLGERFKDFDITKHIATDRDTLLQTGDPDLKRLGEQGAIDKILTTYIPVLENGTVFPINARFNPLVNSGRTSGSEPNLQNLPADRPGKVGGVRQCFVPRPGYVLSSEDYDTLELRALAQVLLHLFGRSDMADAIRANKDLHVEMAANLLGITYEEAEKRYKAGDKEVKVNRDAAKVANFGLPGGLGAATLVEYARTGYGVIMTEQQSLALKKDWLRTWSEMRPYFDHVNSLVGTGEATIEHPLTGFIRGGVGYTEGCNHFFQHLAACGAKRACFLVAWEEYVDKGTPLFGSRTLAFVHDELIVEHPEHVASEAAQRVADVMVAAMSEYIKDLPVTVSPTLMREWNKSAKPVYVDGKLVPWEPKPPSAANDNKETPAKSTAAA